MENRLQHFILSNRQVRHNQQANTYHYIIDYNIPSNLPLRYTSFEFEPRYYTEESWVPNAVKKTDEGFVDAVVAAAKELPAHCRNVTIYIHGFHHMTKLSYKLDVMKGMTDAYCMADASRVVGKFIFFSWPATQTRKVMHDRAYEQGLTLGRDNAKLLEDLYIALNRENISLNLMAHSFGHHILNGLLAAYKGGKKLFDKVFLFAPDIPHGALTIKGGISMDMSDGSAGQGADVKKYNLNPLETVAGVTYCYSCKYDRMLMASTDGNVSKKDDDDQEKITGYLCLGSVGEKYIGDFKRSNVKFTDVLEKVRTEERFEKAFKHTKMLKQMDVILDTYTFAKSNQRFFAILSVVRKPWVDLHRYSYLSNSVIAEVRKQYQEAIPVVNPVVV